MTKNQKRTVIVLAIVLIVFSVLAFALPFKMNGLFWLSYLFGVLAIAVQVYVLKIAFNGTDSVKSKFYGFPIAQIGIIYMAAQLVLSLIFMALAAVAPIWIAIILYVLALAAAAIGFIGADAMRDEIERQDVKLETDTSCITTLRSLVYPLAGRCADTDAKAVLTELADEFRYSDPVSGDALKTVETELETAVAVLQEVVSAGTAEQITNECGKVSKLLAERNRLCKLNKRK